MAAPNTSGALTAATAAMAFSFAGVSLEHFLLGCACYMVGAGGRFGLKVSKALESGQDPRLSAAIAALSVAPFLAAFASMSLNFGAHILGFEGDAAIAIILAIGAFRGPEGIEYIVSLVSKAVPTKLGGAPDDQGAKP